jgi:drug/metabolite transporter (DMT)-like permease
MSQEITRKGLILGILAAVSFSPAFVFIKLLDQDIPPSEIMFIRGVIVVLGMLGVFMIFRKRTVSQLMPAKWAPFWLNGILWAIGSWAFYTALKSTDMSIAVAITMLSPVITVIFSRVFLKERLSWSRYGGVTITLAGILIMTVSKIDFTLGASILAVSLLFSRAIQQSLSAILGKVLVTNESPESYTLTSNAMSIPLALPWIPFETWVIPNAHSAIMLFCFSVLQLTMAIIGGYAVKSLPASVYAILGYLQLPLSALVAYLAFRDPPNSFFYIGSILLIAGAWVACRPSPKS